ncbi:MAG: restriction endonuclease subunit S [Slackia sp.]|uniref:restriction endonuclease subunit S n=1 Tax=Slackia sp. TaxID=2049041 RepID=UPI002840ADE5|nr:restriction endonuclease subunit S [Slackia sp.]MDR3900298.1 restriction endonuclease subunit S [Slackia sp.]
MGELLLFQNGFNGSSESFGSGIPLISVMDVLDDEFITHETVRGKARLNCEEASRYCVEYGDVLFQRSSENQEDAGTSNVYLDQHVSSAFGGFVIRGKKVGEYNPIFIKYLLGSPFIREQITHRAQGAQHINVSQDTLADVVLLMPSMREQEAVGLVFLHLDNLITLHQRKRCNGPFTHPLVWEQRKLGEVFEEYSEKNRADLPPLTIIQGGGTVYRDESNRNLQFDKNSLSSYKAVDPDDFIVHLRSFEGGLEKATCCGLISPAYHTFHGDGIDSDFYYLYFRSKRFIDTDLKPHVYGIRDGRSIDVDGMKTISIPWVTINEQRAIGGFFKSLDSLITLHQ